MGLSFKRQGLTDNFGVVLMDPWYFRKSFRLLLEGDKGLSFLEMKVTLYIAPLVHELRWVAARGCCWLHNVVRINPHKLCFSINLLARRKWLVLPPS